MNRATLDDVRYGEQYQDSEEIPPEIQALRDRVQATLGDRKQAEADRRKEWADQAAALKERMEAERQAEIEAKAKAHEERLAHRAARREAEEKRRARSRWISEGGDPAQFEQEWPGLWADIVRQNTVRGMTAAGQAPSPRL